MKYNLYIRTAHGKSNILDITEKQLNKIVQAYKDGDNDVTISGKKYFLNGLMEIQVFTHEVALSPNEYRQKLMDASIITRGVFGTNHISPEYLNNVGENITDEILGDMSYGEDIVVDKVDENINGEYVNLEIVEGLKKIDSSFDYSKLIRLCEELNTNFSMCNYYSTAKLVRSIINHIPPIFGFDTFPQFVAGYGNKSFKGVMNHLDKSLRNIADGYLHEKIREKEILPNKTQVDFRQDLDVLLAEIIRIS